MFLLLTSMGATAFVPGDNCCSYDKNGCKDGLWVERLSENLTKIVHYSHGEENGIVRVLNTLSNQLYIIGEMHNGEMCGTWLYFDDENNLLMKCEDFHKKNTRIPSSHNYSVKCAPRNCYCTLYYSNGRIKERGRLFFFEDPQMDDSGEYGIWELFDTEGVLIKTVKYE